jgi:hypothetical protein
MGRTPLFRAVARAIGRRADGVPGGAPAGNMRLYFAVLVWQVSFGQFSTTGARLESQV